MYLGKLCSLLFQEETLGTVLFQPMVVHGGLHTNLRASVQPTDVGDEHTFLYIPHYTCLFRSFRLGMIYLMLVVPLTSLPLVVCLILLMAKTTVVSLDYICVYGVC